MPAMFAHYGSCGMLKMEDVGEAIICHLFSFATDGFFLPGRRAWIVLEAIPSN